MTTLAPNNLHNHNRYRLGCRCLVCIHDRSRNRSAIGRQQAAGRWQPWVDADHVREHVTTLLAVGATYASVGAAAGVTPRTVQQLFHDRPGRPRSRRTRTRVAQKILAVRPESANILPMRLDSTGTARRIQALCAIGWALGRQANAIGWERPNLHALLDQERTHRDTVAKIRDLYDRLAMTLPEPGHGVTRVRNDARRKGWFPPLAWDDDTIDDPAALPCLMPPVDGSDLAADELQIQHWAAGHACELSRVEEVEIVRRLIADGTPFSDISKRLHRSPTWVNYVRKEIETSAAGPGAREEDEMSTGPAYFNVIAASKGENPWSSTPPATEVCVCGPRQYCHLDNCQGVDGPLIPCPNAGCQFGSDSLAEMDDHVRSGQC